MKLEGRTALITGAGSGIGLATARRMAAEGANVVLAGIPDAQLDEAARSLQAQGYEALAVPTDVSRPDDVRDEV
ncbi:MAG: SDR family NAD(P)-dependent oxidoreductase, partial [Candidatus Poribacteria bacterium]